MSLRLSHLPFLRGCDAGTSKEHPGELRTCWNHSVYQAAHCASKLSHRCWWWSFATNSCLATTVRHTYISYILDVHGSQCLMVTEKFNKSCRTKKSLEVHIKWHHFWHEHVNSIIPSSIPGEWKQQSRLIHLELMLMGGIRVKQAEARVMHTHCPQD